MSNNSFLVDYLNSAVAAIKELEARKLTDTMSEFAQKVISAIQDTQRALHQNSGVEKLRKYFDDAWLHVQSLRQEIEKVYGSDKANELLELLTVCQLSLQQFQTKLADKLNIEVALEALRDFDAKLQHMKNGLKELATKAIENVAALRDEIRVSDVEHLKTKFESAYASVNELKEGLLSEGSSICSDMKGILIEKITLAQTFLAGFQERVKKLSTLDLAVIALKDIEETAKELMQDAKVNFDQRKEQLAELLMSSRDQVLKFQKELGDGTAIPSTLKHTYDVTKESVMKIQVAMAKMEELAAQQREMLVGKISFVRSCVDDAVQTSKGSISSHISMLNLSDALARVNLMKTQLTNVDNLREHLQKAEEHIQQLMQFERIKALSTEKVKELYESTFQSFNKLRANLMTLTHEKHVYIMELWNSAYTSLTSAAVQQKALTTCMNVTLDTAVKVDKKFNLIGFAKSILETAKSIDENRFSGRLQSKMIDVVNKVGELDNKYVGGRVSEILENTKVGFETRRDETVQKETVAGA